MTENKGNKDMEPEDIIETDEEGNPLSGKSASKKAFKKDSEESEEVIGDAEEDSLQKLREKLKICVEEKQKYLDGWQRDKADFLNARKRDEEQKKEFLKFANENLVVELLPVLESFNMAMANKEVWEKVDKNWRVGVEYIFNQLKKVLEDNGLKELSPLGEKFDPVRDEAVAYEKVDDPSQSNVVIQVVHKGYSLNGRVIKAPKVKVGESKETA